MLNEAEKKLKKAHKRKLMAMIALLLTPIVISYALHYSDYRPGTINYGELIDMVDFEGSAVNQADNTIFRARDLHGKWTMITVDSGDCNEYCDEKLYKMRQVRTVQNKEMHRVERLWLIDDDVIIDSRLLEMYKGTIFVDAKDSELLESLKPIDSQRLYMYLVDPIGNVMMRFPEDADPSEMVEDLKRLLHVSQLEH
jgi:cytochrome oxidase Cu insertion factor (SCO1/SenC/PrrC family)